MVQVDVKLPWFVRSVVETSEEKQFVFLLSRQLKQMLHSVIRQFMVFSFGSCCLRTIRRRPERLVIGAFWMVQLLDELLEAQLDEKVR